MAKLDRKEIEAQVKEILAKELGVDLKKVTDDRSLVNDLGMDSFNAVEITFELENKFGIGIPDEEIKNIKIVNDIVEYIESRLL